MKKTTMDYAMYYLSKGFSVIPLKGKKPVIAWKEFQRRKANEYEIIRWFDNDSSKNIGIVTGAISGIAVVDLDSKEAVSFSRKHFPDTPMVKTRKGFHLYYRYKDGTGNFHKREDLPSIDLRGDGGYVVAPPSIHPSGERYEWVEGRGLDDLPLAELPEMILKNRTRHEATLRELYNGVQRGQRNTSLARLVGSWVRDGLTYEECLTNALMVNSKNEPPLSESEVLATVRSIYEKHTKGEIIQLKEEKNRSSFTKEAGDKALRLLESGDLIKEFLRTCHTRYVQRGKELLLLKLSTISRKLQRGLPVIVTGTSSVGKSELIKVVLDTMWADDKEDFTRISSNYLLYRKDPLDHKVVTFFEMHGTKDSAHIIRTALTEGVIKCGTVTKDSHGGLTPHENTISSEGLVVISSMASGYIDHELDTRVVKIEITHNDQLARDVLRHKAEMAHIAHSSSNACEPINSKNNQERTANSSSAHHNPHVPFEVWRTADYLIKPLAVDIPFADKLADRFPFCEERFMRDFDKVLSLIKASALFHQHQREQDNQGNVIASRTDYELVYGLRELIIQSVSPAPNYMLNFLNKAEELHAEKGAFPTREEIQKELGKSTATIKRYITSAAEKDLIKVHGRGKYQNIEVIEIPEPISPLPEPQKLFSSHHDSVSRIPQSLDFKMN